MPNALEAERSGTIRWRPGDKLVIRGSSSRVIVLGMAYEFVFSTCLNPHLNGLAYRPDMMAVARDWGTYWGPDLLHHTMLVLPEESAEWLRAQAARYEKDAAESLGRAKRFRRTADHAETAWT